MSKQNLSAAIKHINKEMMRPQIPKKPEPYVRLFCDAKPSESIQPHDLPGLAVAAILIYGENTTIVDVPVDQYKEYDRSEKAETADALRAWMKTERENRKLTMIGFMNALDQNAAAHFGLDLIEELPNTHVEKHYDGYRLCFGDEHIDFAQAVALIYYMITVSFGVLRAATSIEEQHRPHMIALLDRFPDASKGDFVPGKKAPPTQGIKFVKYVKANAATWVGIDEDNKKSGIAYEPDTLEGWRNSRSEAWKDPKSHPHFTLVDWLVASAAAHRFPEEFIAEFKKSRKGRKPGVAEEARQALENLYQEFKQHTIFEIANEETLAHIVGNHSLWEVPENAKQFILERATG